MTSYWDTDDDGKAEAPYECLAADRQIVPQFGALDLFLKRGGNERWFGKKERVYGNDVRQHQLPGGDKEANGEQSKPEPPTSREESFCRHV